MSETQQQAPARPDGQGAAARRIPFWKKALLAVACALMIVGLGLEGFAYVRGPSEPKEQASPGGGGVSHPGVKGFAPSPSEGSPSAQPDESAQLAENIEDWYPAIFRLGFSFFVGFCIAYALRVFFKVSIFVIGVFLLGLFGLQYAGVVQVDWSAMEAHYNSTASWLAGQVGSFRDFITGYLPSASSGVAGMVIGFKKH